MKGKKQNNKKEQQLRREKKPANQSYFSEGLGKARLRQRQDEKEAVALSQGRQSQDCP